MLKKTVILTILIFTMKVNINSRNFSRLLDGYYAHNRFWGSVIIVENEKITYKKSYGFADKDKKIKNDETTLFDIGSVSKTITAAAILKLHDEGKLSIYDRVDKYIPSFIAGETRDIKIINLLNHTSGIEANIWQMDEEGKGLVLPQTDAVTLEQMIEKFRTSKLKKKPGSEFEYNNYGYSLLAYIVQQVSGMDFISYLNKEIFAKTGMKNTCFKTSPVKPISVGYQGIGTINPEAVKANEHPSWGIGAGFIQSSATDLSLFINAVFSNKLFSEKTLKLMTDTLVKSNFPGVNWCLGWMNQDIGGAKLYGHAGSIHGYASKIAFIPEKNISVIVLSNFVREINLNKIDSRKFAFVDEIIENIVKSINNQDVKYLPLPDSKSRPEICGSYKLDSTHFITVKNDRDSLFLSFNKNTVFDYYYYKQITDTSECLDICNIFNNSLLKGNFDGFEKYVTTDLQNGLFNKGAIGRLTGGWNYITSQSGTFMSFSIYNKTFKIIKLPIW